jgi:hypothetical protein
MEKKLIKVIQKNLRQKLIGFNSKNFKRIKYIIKLFKEPHSLGKLIFYV